MVKFIDNLPGSNYLPAPYHDSCKAYYWKVQFKIHCQSSHNHQQQCLKILNLLIGFKLPHPSISFQILPIQRFFYLGKWIALVCLCWLIFFWFSFQILGNKKNGRQITWLIIRFYFFTEITCRWTQCFSLFLPTNTLLSPKYTAKYWACVGV